MKTEFQVLFPDGAVLHGDVNWPESPGRDLIESLVKPYLSDEPIEIVRMTRADDTAYDMVIAEMGHVRLTSRAPLAINFEATKLYGAWFRRRHGPYETTPAIAGAAVVFERAIR